MRGNDFVFDSIVEKFQTVSSIVAFTYVKVFYSKLFGLAPSNLKSLRCHFVLFQGVFVKQIEHFLVIDLQKRTVDRHFL